MESVSLKLFFFCILQYMYCISYMYLIFQIIILYCTVNVKNSNLIT